MNLLVPMVNCFKALLNIVAAQTLVEPRAETALVVIKGRRGFALSLEVSFDG